MQPNSKIKQPLITAAVCFVVVVFWSCNFFYKQADKENSDIAAIIPQGSKTSSYATTKAMPIAGCDDTLRVVINSLNCTMSVDGRLHTPNGKLFYDFGLLDPIKELYYAQLGGDLFFFLSCKGDKHSASICRLYISAARLVWTTTLDTELSCQPMLKGQFAYIAANGSVGKITLKNGQFEWRYSKLGNGGKYEYFREIEFPQNHEVSFISHHKRSIEKDTIVINDMTGEIIRMK